MNIYLQKKSMYEKSPIVITHPQRCIYVIKKTQETYLQSSYMSPRSQMRYAKGDQRDTFFLLHKVK